MSLKRNVKLEVYLQWNEDCYQQTKRLQDAFDDKDPDRARIRRAEAAAMYNERGRKRGKTQQPDADLANSQENENTDQILPGGQPPSNDEEGQQQPPSQRKDEAGPNQFSLLMDALKSNIGSYFPFSRNTVDGTNKSPERNGQPTWMGPVFQGRGGSGGTISPFSGRRPPRPFLFHP